MSDSRELKPCPFCGGGAELSHGSDGDTAKVRCKQWGRGCMGAGVSCDTNEQAIAAWNRRAQPERKLTDAIPILPQSLINLIGEYGMARTDGVNPIEVDRRWSAVIAGIKNYARSVLAAQPAATWRIDLSKCQMEPLQPAIAPAIVPQPAAATVPVVTDTDLPALRDILKASAIFGDTVTLSHISAGALFHAMSTGEPQPPAAQAPDDGEKK